MRIPLIGLGLSLQLDTAFSSPSTTLTNPSLPLAQNPAALNFSKPTSDAFPIPDTNLIINFNTFGPILDVYELNNLLTTAQDDIQRQINRYGTEAPARYDISGPWRTEDIAFEVYKVAEGRHITLGQFRSLVEGLGLYMIKGGRSREAIFRLREDSLSTQLAGGDLWLISDS